MLLSEVVVVKVSRMDKILAELPLEDLAAVEQLPVPSIPTETTTIGILEAVEVARLFKASVQRQT